MNNNEQDIRLVHIHKQRSAIPNCTSQNGLLSKLSSTFKEVMFSESKLLAGTLVLDTRYKHPESQNNNLFYLFNSQLDYPLAHYFVHSKTTKYNIDKFRTNSLMKLITKNLSYYNIDK